MEKTTQILKILNVLAWMIFVLLSIQAGAFLFNVFFSLVINPVGAKYFQRDIDLSNLYAFSTLSFFAETLMMVLVAAIKAYLFYLIVLIFKTLNMIKPFSVDVERFIFKMSYVALVIGALSLLGIRYSEGLIQQGVKLPEMYKYFGGGDVFLMMAAILFVIAQVFKRGIEIQSENDLTV
jgi:hypothetical protein